MKKNRIILLALLSSGIGAANAGINSINFNEAEFVTSSQSYAVSHGSSSPQQFGSIAASVNHGVFSQVGSPTVEDFGVAKVAGYAVDTPLKIVLDQIVPVGWKVLKNKEAINRSDVDINMLVSWQGGKRWFEVIKVMSESHCIDVTVVWGKKEIHVSGCKYPAVAQTLKPAYSGVTKKTLQSSGKRPLQVAPVVVAKEWVLKGGKTLKENVIEWGKRESISIKWNAVDYSIDDDVVMYGEFDSESGPISQLAKMYGPLENVDDPSGSGQKQAFSRVDVPLVFELTTNNVLVVEEYKYEQLGFPQYKNGSKQ